MQSSVPMPLLSTQLHVIPWYRVPVYLIGGFLFNLPGSDGVGRAFQGDIREVYGRKESRSLYCMQHAGLSLANPASVLTWLASQHLRSLLNGH